MFAVALQCLFVNEDVKSPNGIMPNHRTPLMSEVRMKEMIEP